MKSRAPRGRRLLRLLFRAIALVVLLIVFSEWRIRHAAAGLCFTAVSDVPHRRAGLVLGAGRKLAGGRLNGFFVARIKAATELFKAGRVDYLIASGDNGYHGYDEASDMKRDLIASGVPADRIYCDYAGFRTLDSVVRAKEIFGQTDLVIVSQHFHNERAVFLAHAHGLDAVGYDAADVPGRHGARARLREVLARTAAVLDVYVLHRGPKFLGPPVQLGVDPAPDV